MLSAAGCYLNRPQRHFAVRYHVCLYFDKKLGKHCDPDGSEDRRSSLYPEVLEKSYPNIYIVHCHHTVLRYNHHYHLFVYISVF